MGLHVVKRDEMAPAKAWIIRIVAILLAVLVCALIMVVCTGENPLSIYASLFNGAVGSKRKIWLTLQDTAILLIVSVALTPAFKMQFWNIGGEGQILMGALASAACMIVIGDKIPQGLLILLMVITSVAAGAVWGLIPAIFKAKWNTNETLSTLMMNYIATQLVAYYIIVWEVPKGSGTIGIINQSTQAGWLANLFGSKYLLSVLVAVLVAVGMLIYLKYTKHGYEIAVVGESTNTAKYIGIKVDKVIIRTMLLSGGLCGIAGFLLVAGINHTLTGTISGGIGFTAVMISWLSQFNPLTMSLASFLICFMEKGAGNISTTFGLNQSFADIMTGILLFFLIGCEFFVRYKMVRKNTGKGEK